MTDTELSNGRRDFFKTMAVGSAALTGVISNYRCRARPGGSRNLIVSCVVWF